MNDRCITFAYGRSKLDAVTQSDTGNSIYAELFKQQQDQNSSLLS